MARGERLRKTLASTLALPPDLRQKVGKSFNGLVSRHLTSPSMLCLISFQDWMSIDEKLRLPDENAERINIPANPRHYWRYRMHLTIEQLLKADELNKEISTLIIQSGRK